MAVLEQAAWCTRYGTGHELTCEPHIKSYIETNFLPDTGTGAAKILHSFPLRWPFIPRTDRYFLAQEPFLRNPKFETLDGLRPLAEIEKTEKYTFSDIKYLGFSELILGCIALFNIGYGLIFWILGFGILHIVYGLVMFKKYK